MTQTFTQDVLIDGSVSTLTQLRVQGAAGQTESLQTWELDGSTASDPLARVTKDGTLQVGTVDATPDSLIEARVDTSLNATKPKRGLQVAGKIANAAADAITWSNHELELTGTNGVTTVQAGLRSKLTDSNSGASTTADIRAADAEAINTVGTNASRVGRLVGLRGTATNNSGAYTNKLIGVEGAVNNSGGDTTNNNVLDAAAFEVASPTISNNGTVANLYGLRIPNLTQGDANYAIKTGLGKVDLGDTLAAPRIQVANTIMVGTNGPIIDSQSGTIRIRDTNNATDAPLNVSALRVTGGTPSAGRVLTSDASGNASWQLPQLGPAPLQLSGNMDTVQLLVKGNSIQSYDLQQWQKSDGTVIAALRSAGSLWLSGQADDVRLLVKGSPTQTNDLQQWQNSTGSVLASIDNTGRLNTPAVKITTNPAGGKLLVSDNAGNGTWQSLPMPLQLTGINDSVQLMVKGNSPQTNDFQQWQMNDGSVVATLTAKGSFALYGQQDEIRWIIKGSPVQTADLLQLQLTDGTVVHSVSRGGATNITGTRDEIQLLVKGSSVQTADIAQWQTSSGATQVAIDKNGLLIAPNIRITPNAGSGKVLMSNQYGDASWQTPPSQSPLMIAGVSDTVQLTVKGNTPQSYDLQQWQKNDGTIIAAMHNSGALWLYGASDDIRILAKGSPTQTNDLQQWQDSAGTVLAAISSTGKLTTQDSLWLNPKSDTVQFLVKSHTTQTYDLHQWQNSAGVALGAFHASGALWLSGQADDIRMLIKGSPTQTNDLQQWQNNAGGVVAAVDNAGQLTVDKIKIVNGAGAGKYLKSDAAGLASWGAISASDISAMLAAPGPIGSTTPNTGAFTTLKATTGAGAGKFLKSDASGNGTWNSLATADIATALTAPGPIGGTTPSTGAFTTLKMTTGAGAAKFLKSDASGNGTWNSLATADIATALTAPGPIGSTTPSTGAFTTLTTQSVVTSTLADAGTTSVVNAAQFIHNSTATPAANFGVGLLLGAKSDTTNDRAQGRIRTQWVVATDASRQAKMSLNAYDTVEREGLAIQASGSAAMIGFLGATPAIRQTGGVKTAAATYGTNEQSMLQIVYNALRTYGLLT